MQTITRAQAKLLANGFLNNLGIDKSDIKPLRLDETLAALYYAAGIFVAEATENLNRSGNTGTGALAKSFKIIDPQEIGKNIHIDIEALFYSQFLNKGVKGTKGGSGQYSFKSSHPSRAMVKSIQAWINTAKISSVNSNPRKTISGLESKRASISQFDQAYAVARSIKMKGIKPTGFIDKALIVTQTEIKNELGRALVVDVINSLPKKINY